MKNRTFFLLLLVPLLYSCELKREQSDFEKFTGRWTLHIVEVQMDSLTAWKPRLGNYKNRQGFILYDGRGGMGVHHVTEHYQDYQFEGKGGLDSLTKNDLRHFADNFVYFGKYRINETSKIIEHHIESASRQDMWGSIAKRSYLFSGDTLILNPISNTYPKSRLKWIRLNDLEL